MNFPTGLTRQGMFIYIAQLIHRGNSRLLCIKKFKKALLRERETEIIFSANLTDSAATVSIKRQ